MAIAHKRVSVAGLITAGRRECWGSQTSGAEGHRNNAVPFCFCACSYRRSVAGPSRPRGEWDPNASESGAFQSVSPGNDLEFAADGLLHRNDGSRLEYE